MRARGCAIQGGNGSRPAKRFTGRQRPDSAKPYRLCPPLPAALLTFLHLISGYGLACCLALLLAQAAVLLHRAPHLDLQPVDFVADVVHLAVETVVELEVALLAVAAAADVTLIRMTRSVGCRVEMRAQLALAYLPLRRILTP